MTARHQGKDQGDPGGHHEMNPPADSPLPYSDVKPVGAADFYSAVNATFRFILRKTGMEGLRRYWAELGRGYYAPVADRWRTGGLLAVAAYWRAFFDAEPGAVAEVELRRDEVVVEVGTCPAIGYLRAHGREITPCFCQHCYFVSEAIGQGAGVEVRVSGGDGRCVQRFAKAGHFTAPQALEEIRAATSLGTAETSSTNSKA
ncbi:MAG TPA: hypothetical protein DIT64_22370 [Verrucomicrobiales bacterium]|nr:hypothetical protein [Verrucomicrobiales bacterium]